MLALEAPALGLSEWACRGYQIGGIAEARRRLAAGMRRVLVVAPTGAGKTSMFAHIARLCVERDQPVLILAHRVELIDQTYARLLSAGIPRAWLGVIRGGDTRRNPGARVHVASVDTLRGWVGSRALPKASVVIVDEAHRSAAASYVKIADAYRDAKILGFTATPWRLDGKGLREQFDDLVVVATLPQMIDAGYLVPLRCYSHPTGPDLAGVATRGGDFVQEDLAKTMLSSVLLGSLVEEYRRRALGRAAFAFAVSIEHAQEIAASFNAADIPAAAIHGETEGAERSKALEDLRAGRIQVLANVQLFTEGTDVQDVKCLILARPTLSHALAFQMIGRGMRPCPATGFEDCVVLDHAGVLAIHGHPLEPQEYNLEPPKKRKVGAAQTKECPACGETVSLAATMCPCGHAWERAERERLVEVPGQLVEAAPRPPVELTKEEERKRIYTALGIARKAGVGNVEAYARGILRKQLRREPDPAVWASCVAPRAPIPSDLAASIQRALLAKKNPPPSPEPSEPSGGESDEWGSVRFASGAMGPTTPPTASTEIVEASF